MDETFLDQTIGKRLHWSPRQIPPRKTFHGNYVDLEPMTVNHAPGLYRESHGPGMDEALWLYLPYGPFESEAAFTEFIEKESASTDPQFYTVIPKGGEPAGQVSLMRIEPTHGVIETGHIWFGASMQRTPAGTEAIYMLGKYVFEELGYRRFEWKCHNLNERSKAAAQRFGFTFEGIFRNAIVVRDRNRDTAWFSITDDEWPKVKQAFETWLDPANFDDNGNQKQSLRQLQS